MRKLSSVLLAAALLVSTALSAEPIPAPQYVRYMNATDCPLRLVWYNTPTYFSQTAIFKGQTISYSSFYQGWSLTHPHARASELWLATTNDAVGTVAHKVTTASLAFAFNATNMALPLRHGQLGVCNHNRVVFDFYVSGDALVFRVVPLPSTKGVTLK